jgi:hypothetical protein
MAIAAASVNKRRNPSMSKSSIARLTLAAVVGHNVVAVSSQPIRDTNTAQELRNNPL